jgi:hypothetical protein
MKANAHTTTIAISVWRDTVIPTYGIGIEKNGVASLTPGMKRSRYKTKNIAAAAIAPAKPAINDVQPVRKPTRRLAQIHILATRTGSQRGKFRVAHGAAERQRAADEPRRQEQPRIGNAGGDEDGEEENAPADDIGYDNRRPVQRAEATFETL